MLQVYCNTCLTTVVTDDRRFSCGNTGPHGCPMPYSFEVFDSETDAQKRYDAAYSWMPKFYFQPLDTDTGKKHLTQWCVAWIDSPVQTFTATTLSHLIRPNTLLLLESGFAHEGSVPLSIIEATGDRLDLVEPIRGVGARLSIPANCCEYCRYIRGIDNETDSGNARCIAHDLKVSRAIVDGTNPPGLLRSRIIKWDGVAFPVHAYVCWAGLVDYACPITVNERILAVVLAGQYQLASAAGQSALQEGIQKVTQVLHADPHRLKDLASADSHTRTVSESELFEPVATLLPSIAAELSSLAGTAYLAKRHERESYFIREITHLVESASRSAYGVRAIPQALKRLSEYLALGDAFFLMNLPDAPTTYELAAKGSAEAIVGDETAFTLSFDPGQCGLRERISVFEVTNNPKYSELSEQLCTMLPELGRKRLWAASFPLVGINQGLWLFYDPHTVDGVRQAPILGPFDKNFLARFVTAIRDIVQKAIAHTSVMRCIGHGLVGGIQSMLGRDRRILKRATNEDIRTQALHNISEMQKFNCLVDNLRTLFVRRSRENYSFRKGSLTRPVMEVYEALIYDDEVLQHNIELRHQTYRVSA